MENEDQKQRLNEVLEEELVSRFGESAYYSFDSQEAKQIVDNKLTSYREIDFAGSLNHYFKGVTPAYSWKLDITKRLEGDFVSFRSKRRGARLLSFILLLLVFLPVGFFVFSGGIDGALREVFGGDDFIATQGLTVLLLGVPLFLVLNGLINKRFVHAVLLTRKERKLDHSIEEVRLVITRAIEEVFPLSVVDSEDDRSFSYRVRC